MKIIKISELTPEERAVVENEIKEMALPEPAEHFDEMGLRYSTQHLAEVSSDIVFLPLEYASKYVDKVCKHNVDGDYTPTLLKFSQSLDAATDPMNFPTVSATAVGNAAYCALHGKDEKLTQAALKFLTALSDWKCEQLGISISEEDNGN